MDQAEIVRIPAESSKFGVDEIFYTSVPANRHMRAARLQARRWHIVQDGNSNGEARPLQKGRL